MPYVKITSYYTHSKIENTIQTNFDCINNVESDILFHDYYKICVDLNRKEIISEILLNGK
jgi:hypothetical protein